MINVIIFLLCILLWCVFGYIGFLLEAKLKNLNELEDCNIGELIFCIIMGLFAFGISMSATLWTKLLTVTDEILYKMNSNKNDK